MNLCTEVLLIDPNETTRQPLLGTLNQLEGVRVTGTLTSYDTANAWLSSTKRDLTVVVLDSDPTRGSELVCALLEADPGAKIVPAATARDAEVMLRVFRAGASEFLLLPTSPNDLRSILTKLAARPKEQAQPTAPRTGKVIAVTGASGGVGCTTLAVNLAVALTQEGAGGVALADFDLASGLIAPWLDIEHESQLSELSANVHRLDHLLLRRAMTRHDATGLMVLPHLKEIANAADIDAKDLGPLVDLMRESFDTVVIDTGKGLSATDMVALEKSDAILLVVQLDVMYLHNAIRLLKLFRGLDGLSEKVHIVLNRVGSSSAEIRLKKVEEALGMPVSWRVPNAFRAVHQARCGGEPIRNDGIGREAYHAFHGLARQLLPSGNLVNVSDRLEAGPTRRRSGWWPCRPTRSAAS